MKEHKVATPCPRVEKIDKRTRHYGYIYIILSRVKG